MTNDVAAPGGRHARPRYSRLLRWLAPVVIVGWLVATGAALIYIPPLAPIGSRNVIGSTISRSSPAIKAQILDAKRFAFPLGAQEVVVQHRSQGLSAGAQLNTLRRAIDLDRHALPGLRGIGGAVPVANDSGVVSGLRGRANTALTFLLYPPRVNFARATVLAEEYGHRYLGKPADGLVGVTGAYAAETAQNRALSSSLSLVEWLAVGILLLVVGLTFRSVVAPLLALVASAVAYEVSERLLSLATIHLGVTVPAELDPIIVVLLLGLMTDYTVFYLTAFRRHLAAGGGRAVAAPLAFSEVTPIVFVAGFTVAAGVALIELAHLHLFRSLAAGLTITVSVTVLVAVTFLPAALGLLGRFVLWPKKGSPEGGRGRLRMQRIAANRWIGSVLVLVAVAALVWVSLPIGRLSLGVNLIADLSSSSQTHRAMQAAGKGFAPGVVAPSEVLVSGPGTNDAVKLSRLQSLLGRQPGVAGVVGPADKVSGMPAGVFVSSIGPSARYLVVFKSDPFGSAAIEDLDRLEGSMHRLLATSGISGATVRYAGDTAISAEVAHPARSDLVTVALAVIIVDFLLLALFLRSLIAPLVLVGASVLVVAASLGLVMRLFPSTATVTGFTFYVPFAAEVLLLSFGADYNLFLTGEIWRSARERKFREAIAHGGAVASRGINVAGATLGLTFAVLIVVPLSSFVELGVAMLAGLLIDTFIVRFFVVPGVLSVLGSRAGWPGHRIKVSPRSSQPTEVPRGGADGGDGSRRPA